VCRNAWEHLTPARLCAVPNRKPRAANACVAEEMLARQLAVWQELIMNQPDELTYPITSEEAQARRQHFDDAQKIVKAKQNPAEKMK
jgi:hypothetical protein